MWLFGAALVLVSIGVVMVYSASAILAADRFGDPHYFLKRQLFWALLGLGGLWAALAVDYRVLERVAVARRSSVPFRLARIGGRLCLVHVFVLAGTPGPFAGDTAL